MAISKPTLTEYTGSVPNRNVPGQTFSDDASNYVDWFSGDAIPYTQNAVAFIEQESDSAAASATASALSAAASGAPLWVSAGSYTSGDIRVSPANGWTYIAKTTHSGETNDPSADATRWEATANLVPQADKYDFTAGKLLTVGAGGLIGGNGATQQVPDNNINDFDIPPGAYFVNASTTGIPDETNFAFSIPVNSYVRVERTVLQVAQTFYPGVERFGDLVTLRRFGYNLSTTPVWSEWRIVYDSSTVIGPMDVDGDGVPTGALIDSGSGVNGHWVRFADGTQICTCAVTVTSSGATAHAFPAAFHAAPEGMGALSGSDFFVPFVDNVTTTGFDANMRSIVNAALVNGTVEATFVGRWRA